MSPEERQKYLDSQLKDLVSYAYKNAPGIRARFDKAGIDPSKVSAIKDLENLPILRKDTLIEMHKAKPPFGELVTTPIQELQRVYVSPGPIYDPYHQSESFWHRHVQLTYDLGFIEGDIVVNTWSYHLVPAGLLVDEFLRRAGVVVIPTGVGNTELQVQIMHHLKVTGFFGTAGFLLSILNKAEEMGYDIRKDLNLRVAFAGAEMGGGPIRTQIEQNYGIATRDAYGNADIGLISYECGEKSGMHLCDDVIVEIINPETEKPVAPGEVGEVVGTPIDEGYPLIRFGTGDLSALTYEPCSCGRTSPRLTKIVGRVGDAVRTRGMFIHPKELNPAVTKFSEIALYQAVVTRSGHRDELTLKVELKQEEGVDKAKLIEQLSKSVNDAVRIKLDRVEFIAKGVIPEEHKLIVDERKF